MSQNKKLIEQIIEILIPHFSRKKLIEASDEYNLVTDLYKLLKEYVNEDVNDGCRYLVKYLIPYLKACVTKERDPKKMKVLYSMLKESYCYAGRRSLEHFIIYYEWEWADETKLLENRYDILIPYVYYLNKMAFDPNLQWVLCAMPSGWGKSRIMKYYEAWRLGVQSDGCFIALCSNDDLVKSLSRSVIDIIKTEEFAKVFPHLNYNTNHRIFTKETDGEWKLNSAGLASSYIAKSRDANIVGIRASLSIDIDDMYADSTEALDMTLHKRLWDKLNTVILARFIRNKLPQVVMSGTMWSPYDLVCQVIQWQKGEKDFHDDPKFKYCEIADDGSVVIIRIPALDPETDESTCPNIESTEKLKNIRNRISSYLWQCNFQQNPIPPEGLDFDWDVLTTYEQLPDFELDPQFNKFKGTFATLDPARRGKNYVSMPIFKRFDDNNRFILIDCLYKKRAMNELYELIVDKIILHGITRLVVENNIDTSLKKVLDDMLHERGYYLCDIIEKYSLANKEQRIKDNQGLMRNNIIYPSKNLLTSNTDMYKFMEHFTTYSFDFPNKFDDSPDSVGMFCDEIIDDKSDRHKSVAISRRMLGI